MPPTKIRIILIPFDSHCQEGSSTQTSSREALHCEFVFPRKKFYSRIFFLRSVTKSKRSLKNEVLLKYLLPGKRYIVNPFTQERSSTQTSSSWEMLHCENVLPRKKYYSNIFFPRSLTLWNRSPKKEVQLRHLFHREVLHCENVLPRRNFYTYTFFPRSLIMLNRSPTKFFSQPLQS